jgi:Lipopolysaccharide-assembly
MNLSTKMKHIRIFKEILLILILFVGGVLGNFGCCTYSFSGASVPEHLKTIAIPVAEDRSGAGIPGLRELLTEQLINKFIEDNSLQVAERTTANAILECTVVSFSDAPAIVSAGENIELRRVTVIVKVSYKDLIKRQTIFDKNFSNYGDYPPGGTVNERQTAIETAVDKISEDILLGVVSGW